MQNIVRPFALRLQAGVPTGDFYSLVIINAINSARSVAPRYTVTVTAPVANTVYALTVADKTISINSLALSASTLAAAFAAAIRSDKLLNNYVNTSVVGAVLTLSGNAKARLNVAISLSSNAPAVLVIAQTVAAVNPAAIPYGRLVAIDPADATYLPNPDGVQPMTLFSATGQVVKGVSVTDQASEKYYDAASNTYLSGTEPYKEFAVLKLDEIVIECDAPINFTGATAPALFARFAPGPGGLYADKIGCLSALSDVGTRALTAAESLYLVGPSVVANGGQVLVKAMCSFR